jgi:hypothetical protein
MRKGIEPFFIQQQRQELPEQEPQELQLPQQVLPVLLLTRREQSEE